MRAAPYLKQFTLAAGATIAIAVGINLVVDPYDLFGSPKIPGFNALKAVISSKQRVFETPTVLRRNDATVILGSSRSDIGISPDHPALATGGAFNAAMSGQQIWESARILEALARRPNNELKTVILGLDFFAFNSFMPTPFDYTDDNFSRWRVTELVFSISTLLDAFRTVIRQQPYPILAHGGIVHENGFREYIGNPFVLPRESFRGSEEGYLRFTYNPPPACAWSATDARRNLDMYQEYQRLLAIAHEHDMDVKMLISPSHARQWETLAAAGLWQQFEDWKRRLVSVNEETARQYAHPAFPLWDFSGYNRVTTFPVPDAADAPGVLYWESSHYRKEVGDLALDRIFSPKPLQPSIPAPDFGTLLTGDSVEPWLAQQRLERQHYRANHRQDIEEIAQSAALVAKNGPCAKKR